MKATCLLFGLSGAFVLAGCNKSDSAAALAPSGGATHPSRPSDGTAAAAPMLTREEVGAVLGQPVISIEGRGTNLTYKTAVLFLETRVELERDDPAEAIRSMNGARQATGALGGKAEVIPGLGDEALFGAMSILYLRKGGAFINIQPPNLQALAASKAMEHVRAAKIGSDDQIKALERFKQIEKTDPLNAGLNAADAKQGALAVIGASSKKQESSYESDARAMAVALATKLLEKI